MVVYKRISYIVYQDDGNIIYNVDYANKPASQPAQRLNAVLFVHVACFTGIATKLQPHRIYTQRHIQSLLAYALWVAFFCTSLALFFFCCFSSIVLFLVFCVWCAFCTVQPFRIVSLHFLILYIVFCCCVVLGKFLCGRSFLSFADGVCVRRKNLYSVRFSNAQWEIAYGNTLMAGVYTSISASMGS